MRKTGAMVRQLWFEARWLLVLKLLDWALSIVPDGQGRMDLAEDIEWAIKSGPRLRQEYYCRALSIVADWRLPYSDYGTWWGSNGERDYMRRIAMAALSGKPFPSGQPRPDLAQGGDTRSAETAGLGPKGEHAVAEGDAPNLNGAP